MKTCLSLAILILIVSSPAIAQTPSEAPVDYHLDEAQIKRVDELFREWNRADSPGCGLAIVKNSRIVYKHDYGISNLDYSIPISAATVFNIGSISKQFTAMSILLLARQGRLSLDDDVRRYVPELPDYGIRITIRNMLQHTSGIREEYDLFALAGWPDENLTTNDDVLEMVSRQKALNFRPGDEYRYSNTNYTLLAIIVKRASGTTLREFAQKQIFEPLNMTRTHFHDDHTMVEKNLSLAYEPREEGGFRLTVRISDLVGDGGLFTTVEDLARWDQNFYDSRVGGREVIEAMSTPGRLNDGHPIKYGFGLYLGDYRGLRTIGHEGAAGGYRANYIQFPDQHFSIICLCNVNTTKPYELTKRVADIVLEGTPKLEDSRASPMALPSAKELTKDLDKMIGFYWNPQTVEVRRVYMKGGRLMLRHPSGTYELARIAQNRFEMVGRPFELAFESSSRTAPNRLREYTLGGPLVFDGIQPVSPTRVQLSDLAGTYYSDELQQTCHILVQGGQLVLQHKRVGTIILQPLIGDTFTSDDLDLDVLTFVRDPRGLVSGLTWSTGRVRRLGFSKVGSRN